MEKKYQIVKIALGIFIAVLILLVVLLSVTRGSKKESYLGNYRMVKSAKYEVADITTITLDVKEAEVEFATGFTTELEVKQYENKYRSSKTFRTTMTNHHLAIIDDYQRHHGGIFSKKEKVKYVITLPQTYNQSLLLRANVTDVTIKDKLEVQNLEIDTQVGAIEINQLVSSKATIKNNIGDIAINQIEGALIINSDIGDVDIEHFLVKGNSQILVNTGDIDIQIADSSNCIIRAKSKLGNNNQTVPKTLNQGLYTLSVTSNIGDIDIET